MKPLKVLLQLGLMVVLALSAFASDASSKEHFYKVRWVIDGDTIQLNNGRHVRLIGIDAPEIKEGDKFYRDLKKRRLSRQEVIVMGHKSHVFLKEMLEGKEISLKYGPQKKDKYRRVLAYVYLPDETFVNAKMVQEGYAYPYPIAPNTEYAQAFQDFYEQAKEQRKGLWQNGGNDEKRIP